MKFSAQYQAIMTWEDETRQGQTNQIKKFQLFVNYPVNSSIQEPPPPLSLPSLPPAKRSSSLQQQKPNPPPSKKKSEADSLRLGYELYVRSIWFIYMSKYTYENSPLFFPCHLFFLNSSITSLNELRNSNAAQNFLIFLLFYFYYAL